MSIAVTTPAPVVAPTDAGASLDPWREFAGAAWRDAPRVREFIVANYDPFEGDESFLCGPTSRTTRLWAQVVELMAEERRRGGVLDIDVHVPSTITSHEPGYVDRDAELIVGLQTDAPLKRAIMPNGGLRMVEQGLEAYGYEVDPAIHHEFTVDRKTHNDGVFDAYTEDIRRARRAAIITGLPDSYGRGRIIGDYRRVALYGVDQLAEWRRADRLALDDEPFSEETMRLREELSEQSRALDELVEMAARYGFDVRRPAATAREAIQWTYLAYLAATKEQNGAAMSLGRVSTFFDVYLQRDIAEGRLTEQTAQELIDDFVIKLRMIRFLRTPAYDELFSGDPTWVTESIGGTGADGRTLVTRTSFRMLQTLHDLGPAPEPNLTVLWSSSLPEGFKRFCARTSIETSSIQYESDELLRDAYGDDTSIACCVSGMPTGQSMQFFGARANLAKALLYAINAGRDEMSGELVVDGVAPLTGDVLDADEVAERFEVVLDWLARTYVEALNIIHYMHDRYAYERIEMALHDPRPHRTLATGIAGLSVTADSLSAIRHASVRPVRDERGIAVDFEVDGEFPVFGNHDDRVDSIASALVHDMMRRLRRQPTYRDAEITQSVLTITSNVVYGAHTGTTPDGRRAGEPFAPGANPMHGRDQHGLVASALSIAQLDYDDARDGISFTASMLPASLGRTAAERIDNLVGVLDGFTASGGFHINVNVLDREVLLDAMEHPERYPHLTIRVSGYAVHFTRLTREQQLDVVGRTFHERL